METSRTKQRREVREKRLAYFEKTLNSHQTILRGEVLHHGNHEGLTPSKNSSRSGGNKERGVSRKPGLNSNENARNDGIISSDLGTRTARRPAPKYPQGPSGDDSANVTHLGRKKSRPLSALPSSRGDNYRLDVGDSARLTGKSQRPSSAKAGARPKRPIRGGRSPKTDHVEQTPSKSSVYRSTYENARRHSEFEDFRKSAFGSPAKKETLERKANGRSDNDLQEFFRLREIRQPSRRDLSPSSSESGLDSRAAQTYSFFKSHSRSQNAGRNSSPDRDHLYGSSSRASLEERITRRVQSQLGHQVDSEALQASEFHSAYSAENMLQSLLGIRKVKAKVHDELLSSFLENNGYQTILACKQERSKAREACESASELDDKRVEAESDQLRYNPSESGVQDNSGKADYQEPVADTLTAIPLEPINISPRLVKQEYTIKSEEKSSNRRLDVNDSASSAKDEAEESGVEMDDLNFDVGALCNAAKQGDDILRQYIRGLTEKVKAKKVVDDHPVDDVQEVSSRETRIAPKMPERKFDQKIMSGPISERTTVPTVQPIPSPSSMESDSVRQKEIECPFEKDDQMSLKTSKDLDAMVGGQEYDDLLIPRSPALHENLCDTLQVSVESRSLQDQQMTLEESIEFHQENVNLEDNDIEISRGSFNISKSLQDDEESLISRVKEPAVTADLLEKLGLYDTNDNSYESTSPSRYSFQASNTLATNEGDSGNLDDSDLGLETFRPASRTISPLKEVRDYSKAGVLTTSHVDSPDLIEELLDGPSTRPSKVETAAVRRTYDLSEDAGKPDIADPNVNTPFHSHIHHSKHGVSFVFNPEDAAIPVNIDVAIAITDASKLVTSQQDEKHGIAFEVDLASARKQPKPPPTSKPSNSRLVTPSRGSPKHSRTMTSRTRPRKSPRTPDDHREEIRHFHEKDRRQRKLSSSPRQLMKSPARSSPLESSSSNNPSLRLNLPSNMSTDRPHAGEVVHESLSEVEFGAPFMHSPRREMPLEDEDEVLDRIASFKPPGGPKSDVAVEPVENQGSVSEIFGHHRENLPEGVPGESRDPHELRPESHKAQRPRPSSANPKRAAGKKPGNGRPTSAHSKMYSSPDKSYDRKWPQSSMAWMTQHKLSTSLLGDDLSASGSKVKISQSKVNREFARKAKPPVAVQMSRQDGEFVRVRSSKLFNGSVSRILEGKGAVNPLTLQLIQDSPRGSESLSIWQLLPDEILLHIFSYIPQRMLVMCALTCRRFHRIAMDDSLWRTIRLENRDLTDFYLTHIGEKHPASLTLHKCRGNLVTENGLRNLFRSCADSLQELNVTGCSNGDLQGDSILLHVSRCYNLVSLDASWCAVTDNGLSAILDGCPRLSTICLNGCQSLSDQCLRQIVNKYGPNLEVLELCGCFNLSPATLEHLAETSTELLTLNIAQCYKISDDCIASVAPKFQSLQHWQLKGCKELRDSAVKKIARHCKQLRKLSIASCPHITDVSLIEIATYLNSIRSLDVSGCRKVGNEGMRCLATCCPYLEKVGLSSTAVTHKSVTSLASYSSQTLRELKLNCCREITESSIIRLLKHCKKLETLHLYGVKGLRNLGILKVQYPCIEYLEKTRRP